MQIRQYKTAVEFRQEFQRAAVFSQEVSARIAAIISGVQERGRTCFWSRSRQKLWRKGETSGHIQHVKEIYTDCDKDCLVVKVDQVGPACHTNERSCFFNPIVEN